MIFPGESLFSRINSVPGCCGVYFFKNNRGHIIYIGKAVNLKRRIQQYFTPGSSLWQERIKVMASSIADISWQLAPSELHALLLEDILIKHHWPMYNKRQKKYLQNIYLVFSKDDFPVLVKIGFEKRYEYTDVFGPYKDRFYADDLIRIVSRYSGLRTCSILKSGEKCLEFDFGQCPGPCIGKIQAVEYQACAAKAAGLLSGDVRDVIAGIEGEMNKASGELDFEKAQLLKDEIRFLNSFNRRQSFINNFISGSLIIRENKKVYRFEKGELVFFDNGSSKTEYPAFPPDQLTPYGVSLNNSRDWILTERAHVVLAWLSANNNETVYKFKDL